MEIIPTLPSRQPRLTISLARTFPILYAPSLLFEEIYERYSPPSVPMSEITTGILALFASFRIVSHADDVVGDTIIPDTFSRIAFAVNSNSFFLLFSAL